MNLKYTFILSCASVCVFLGLGLMVWSGIRLGLNLFCQAQAQVRLSILLNLARSCSLLLALARSCSLWLSQAQALTL